MARHVQLKHYFDAELAVLLADKIGPVHRAFDRRAFIREIEQAVGDLELKQRVDTIADALAHQLGPDCAQAIAILSGILGPENERETGMFTHGYWLMPVARYVEKYGTDHFDASIRFIEELTKRHTGEYAIRPFLAAHPGPTLKIMKRWSKSANFHVRRLASEGPRPRLPWAKKLDLWGEHRQPIQAILVNLKSDPSAFVRKSVANHLGDLLKERREEAMALLAGWNTDATPQTRWIIKHALRSQLRKGDEQALALVGAGR